MKKMLKVFGVIALAAIAGFSLIACDDDSGGGGGSGIPGYPSVNIATDMPTHTFMGTGTEITNEESAQAALYNIVPTLVDGYQSFYEYINSAVQNSVRGERGPFSVPFENASYSNISNINGVVTGSLNYSDTSLNASGEWTNMTYEHNPDINGYNTVKVKGISSGSISESETQTSYNHSEAQAVSIVFVFDGNTYKGRAVLSFSWTVSYNQSSREPNVKYNGKIAVYNTTSDTPVINRNLTKDEMDSLASLYR
jgi:hypothetical protein